MKNKTRLISVVLVVLLTLTSCGYYDSGNTGSVGIKINDYIDSVVDVIVEREQGPDIWGFANNTDDIHTDGYYISAEDYQRLTMNLSDVDIAKVRDKENDLRRLAIEGEDSKHIKWDGSCYGMSSIAVLVNQGQNEPSYFHAGKRLKSTLLDKQAFSSINFYHFQQLLQPAVAAKENFVRLGAVEKIEKIKEVAGRKQAFLISFNWSKYGEPLDSSSDSGHCVMGYGYEEAGEEEWLFPEGDPNAKKYNYRILIYDCSNPEGKYGDSNIYFNDDGSFCVPFWKVYSTDNLITDPYVNNGKFGRLVTNKDFINIIDFKTGHTSEAFDKDYKKSATAMVNVSSAYEIDVDGSTASVHGLYVEDSNFGDSLIVTMSENGLNDTAEVYLPQGRSNYKFTSKDDLKVSLEAGNCYVSVNGDESGSFTFSSDGSVQVTYDKAPKDATVQITSDADSPFGIDGCNTIIVEESGSKDISITPTREGLAIEGASLKDISIKGYVYGSEQAIDVGSDARAIIVQSSETGMSVKGDKDGDGAFESNLGSVTFSKDDNTVTIKDKSATYNGKNINIGRAIIKGKLSKKAVYRYYSDEKCTKEVTAHKNPGVYYVKAYAQNEEGGFAESNVVKLTIKKKANKLTLKSKNITIKKNSNKNVSVKDNVKALGGKIVFSKVSGANNIVVQKSGKLVLKEGTKPGTYNVKVKAKCEGNKYYKPKTQTIKFTIKVK